MTARPRDRAEGRPARPRPAGLRLRIWLGCLGGALASGAGIWWVIGAHTGPGAQTDLPVLVTWLWAIAAAGMIVGIALALWIDRGIVGHLRGLVVSLGSGRVSDLRGLPAVAGWGELSQLTQALQALLTHHRQATRAAEDLGLVREQVSALRESLERWADTGHWNGPPGLPGSLSSLTDAFERGLARLEETREQNLGAARGLSGSVGTVLGEARETAGDAERGFVEATALLTTVRELQRLASELGESIAAAGAAETPSGGESEAMAELRRRAREAIEELVESSAASVEHLSRGLLRVQEIADQVHLVANRATLIALNAALTTTRQGRPEAEDGLAEEMKRLAAEVRAATDRTTRWSLEVEGEIAAASGRMKDVRARVAERLESLPATVPVPPPPAPASGADPARAAESGRRLERVREMIQDATQKGERLSAAGERVSRSAEKLVHRLEEEARSLAALVGRLAPGAPPFPRGSGSPFRSTESSTAATETGAEPDATAGEPAGGASTGPARPDAESPAPPETGGPRAPGLRLLGHQDLMPGGPGPGAPRSAHRPEGQGEEAS